MDVARVAATGDDRGCHALAAGDEVMMNRGDGEQHWNRRAIGQDVLIAQDQQRVPVLDRAVDPVAKRVQGRFEAGRSVGDGKRSLQGCGREAGQPE